MIQLPHNMATDDGLFPFPIATRQYAVRQLKPAASDLRGDLKAMAFGALSALILVAVVVS